MTYFISVNFIILIITVFLNVLLGALIFRNNPYSTTNRIFGALSFVTVTWLILAYLSLRPEFLASSLLLIRTSIFFAIPMSMLLFLLTQTFPYETLQMSRRKYLILLGTTLVVMIIALSPYTFVRVEIVGDSPNPVPGWGIIPFVALTTLFSLGAIYFPLKKLKHATPKEKQQLRLIVFGISLLITLLIVTILIPVVLFDNNLFVTFSPLYTLMFLGITAYAIIKHQLFNIKIIATEALTFILAIATFFEISLSNTVGEILFRMSIFLLVIVFGILLIRSVRREVRQREQLERVTDQLAGANMELKRLDEAKSEFISIASHQLRTPLTAVKGYISMVVEGTYGKLPAAMKRPIQNVYESNERLIRLVNDLLSLSRIESGKIQMQWEKGNIQDIITSVVDELTVKANEKNLKLIFKNPEVRIPQIRLDQDKIRNVVLNLIDNAIKYTEKGSITITAGKKQKVLHLEFADTGAGMTRQEIGKLFQSFTRGDAGARSWTGGSGLGLYVAKQFVIMHKGTIWAESRGKGKGSIFIVELPIP